MNADRTLDAIDDVLTDWQGSDDSAHWTAPRPDEWADVLRPALVPRIAADAGRDPADVGRLLDELQHTRPDDVDPARVVELFAPTGAALFGAPVTDALARIEEAPDGEDRRSATAQLAQVLAPAVVQAILAKQPDLR
ncbi:hypothetical protein GCM10017559_08360 [Streptosporangium longisporum]|uniref:DUF2267 domain-containing protein n=1 Tax=Streptosporangium longisporum TaxID=46187 RepID=A0ABN3XRP4_9ACTN